jgi:hypothetical protein
LIFSYLARDAPCHRKPAAPCGGGLGGHQACLPNEPAEIDEIAEAAHLVAR